MLFTLLGKPDRLLELVKIAHVTVGRHFDYLINDDNTVSITKSKDTILSGQKALFWFLVRYQEY